MFVFFFFKQKTAYEMRISDWSSDVCSSDLKHGHDVSRSPLENCRLWPRSWRAAFPHRRPGFPLLGGDCIVRSEEHTSELQSLMRISYAVFCLKKKKTNPIRRSYQTQNSTTTI